MTRLAKRVVHPRVAFIKNIPTVYNLPILEKLCDDERWDLSVYFCGESHADRSWDIKVGHPKMRVLGGWKSKPHGPQWFTNHLNPGIIHEILRSDCNLVVVGGYAVTTFQLAMALARIKGIPYVINTETHVEVMSGKGLGSRIKQLVKHKICRNAAAFLVTGSRVRSHLISFGISDERIFVFPNTCDVPWFKERANAARDNRVQVRKKCGLDSEHVILCVCRLVGVKNVKTLIKAYSLLNANLRNSTSLVLVGDGDSRLLLEKQALDLGLENVRFLGHRGSDELAELYGSADLFALLSTFEPWGVVVNEAAASGLPLVVSKEVGAGDDLVRDGENGYVVDSMDALQIAQSMERILLNQSLARLMGERSLHIVQDWTYDRCVQGFSDMIDYALST